MCTIILLTYILYVFLLFHKSDRIAPAIRASPTGRIPLSFDYVIAAELVGDEGSAIATAGAVSSGAASVAVDDADLPDSILLEALQALDGDEDGGDVNLDSMKTES